ncbi:DUF6471 domain-containing protein [Vibrio genomosp. F10]|nr:DUF6471 domain-containing protein [Vibrio genomosp. F10]
MIEKQKPIVKSPKTQTEKELDAIAKDELKHEINSLMSRYQVSYEVAAERLTLMGRTISEQGLRNKVSKGTYQAVWYHDFIRVMKQDNDGSLPVDIDEIIASYEQVLNSEPRLVYLPLTIINGVRTPILNARACETAEEALQKAEETIAVYRVKL